jgi:hypothetical protein
MTPPVLNAVRNAYRLFSTWQSVLAAKMIELSADQSAAANTS